MKRILGILLVLVMGSFASEYSSTITFSGYSSGRKTLTNFTALVVLGTNIPGFSYSQFAYPNDGQDLRFYSGTTQLNYEIDHWTNNGSSFVWVQIPLLTYNTAITAKWGNPANTYLTQSTNVAAWDVSSYKCVWHMKNASIIMTNDAVIGSETNRYGTYKQGSTYPSEVDGLIGKAQFFNGTSSHFWRSTQIPVIETNITVSALINATSSTNTQVISSKYFSGNGWILLILSSGIARFDGRDAAGAYYITTPTSPVLVTNGWHHVTGVRNGSIWSVYTDGMLGGSTNVGTTGSIDNKLGTNYIGVMSGIPNSFLYNGLIDNVNIHHVGRSSDWIWAEYMNMLSNTVFQVYGSGQQVELPQYKNQLGDNNEL